MAYRWPNDTAAPRSRRGDVCRGESIVVVVKRGQFNVGIRGGKDECEKRSERIAKTQAVSSQKFQDDSFHYILMGISITTYLQEPNYSIVSTLIG